MGGRHTKRMEFSKKILVFTSVVNLAVIIFSCFMIYITKDLFLRAALPWIAVGLLLAVFFAKNAGKEKKEEQPDNSLPMLSGI